MPGAARGQAGDRGRQRASLAQGHRLCPGKGLGAERRELLACNRYLLGCISRGSGGKYDGDLTAGSSVLGTRSRARDRVWESRGEREGWARRRRRRERNHP